MGFKHRDSRFTALKIEGGILPHEFLDSVAALKAPNQTDADYGISKSLSIKEELARYWRIASDLFDQYANNRRRIDLQKSQYGIERWLVPFLAELLGYRDLTEAKSIKLDERTFNLTHHAFDGYVPFLLLTDDFDLDKTHPRLEVDGYRIAPQITMQEYLNTADAALWGIISNGSKLRLLRENVSLARPSYIDVDLELMFSEELYSDFAALWLTFHASRLKPLEDSPSGCIIESWRAEAHDIGERVRENLRVGVTRALRQFGNGFLQHPSNITLRAEIESGRLSSESYFQQLLRLIYRLLFLFTVEERDLLHKPSATNAQREVYSEGYSLARLRERALRRRHYDKNCDLWHGVQITFNAVAKGATGLGLPELGGLFRDDQCPHLDEALISNSHLLEAIHALTFFRSDQRLSRVNYKDMYTEELGSVYESLLELQPTINVKSVPWKFGFYGDGEGEQVKGSERKLTGSYYTPPSLVNELIKSTLDPVIERVVRDCPEDPRLAILALKVVDPACGSGHFLLAAARRMATEIARQKSDSDVPDESMRQHELREVVQNCIYGVDRNSFAVEICKTALWIETVEPGKPLAFLDSHILQGDSLVGILDPEIMAEGIPDNAYKPLKGDYKEICLALKKGNIKERHLDLFDRDAMLEVAVENIDFEMLPEETLNDVERKRVAWKIARISDTRSRENLRANLFVGAYFAPKVTQTREIVPNTQDINRLDDRMPQRRGVEESIQALADTNYFFHWHLEFPEIMHNGGFDVVLGNPPWEVLQLNEVEFFSPKSPRIANLKGNIRKQEIANPYIS